MLRIPHIFGKRPDDDSKIKFRLNSADRTKGPGHLCLETSAASCQHTKKCLL